MTFCSIIHTIQVNIGREKEKEKVNCLFLVSYQVFLEKTTLQLANTFTSQYNWQTLSNEEVLKFQFNFFIS